MRVIGDLQTPTEFTISVTDVNEAPRGMIMLRPLLLMKTQIFLLISQQFHLTMMEMN